MCNYDRVAKSWTACAPFKNAAKAILDGRHECHNIQGFSHTLNALIRKDGILLEGYEQRDIRRLQSTVDYKAAEREVEEAIGRKRNVKQSDGAIHKH